MIKIEQIPATDLRTLGRNLRPQMVLKANDPFYVSVDHARNSNDRVISSRTQMKIALEEAFYENNIIYNSNVSTDDMSYAQLLLVGHQATGKTTELQILCDEIKDEYASIMIDNIASSEDEFGNDKEFIYFIARQVVQYCSQQERLNERIGERVWKMLSIMEQTIFSQVQRSQEEMRRAGIDATFESSLEAGGGLKGIFEIAVKVLGKVSAKRDYTNTEITTITTNEQQYFSDFLETMNELLKTIDDVLLGEGRMLLLIIDGLDKLSNHSKSESIFLSDKQPLTRLACNMIVTYPVYLCHSPEYVYATGRFYGGKPIKLRQIKVHEKDNTNCEKGIEALREIVKRRIDVEALLENPDDLTEAIMNSGGNIRDLFQFLRTAGLNARGNNSEKITTEDFIVAYTEKKGIFKDMLNHKYLEALKKIMADKSHTLAVENFEDTELLLKLFSTGMLVEYNGEGWYDIHPLLKEIVLSHDASSQEETSDESFLKRIVGF